jgi:hypothetical protein
MCLSMMKREYVSVLDSHLYDDLGLETPPLPSASQDLRLKAHTSPAGLAFIPHLQPTNWVLGPRPRIPQQPPNLTHGVAG